MKNIIFLGLSLILFCNCENKKEIKDSIEVLNSQKSSLTTQVNILNNDLLIKRDELNSLDEKLKELKIYESGKTPKYILKLHLKQTHLSLSISKHIKDAMNAMDFEMPVDKEFYESVSVGTDIVNNFRVGSCILYGSFGDWKMTVKGKEVRN